MNRRFNNFLQLLLGGLDFLTINLVVVISSLVISEKTPSLLEKEYSQMWLVLIFSWVIVAWVYGIYNEKYITSFELFSRRSMGAYLYWIGLVLVYLNFVNQFELSRTIVFVSVGSFGIMLIVNRFIYLIAYHYFKKKEYLTKKVLILGYNEISKKLAGYLENEGLNTQIIGYCDESEKIDELSHYPILGKVSDVMTTSLNYEVNEIYCTISPESDYEIYNLMQKADEKCILFRLVPDMNYFVKGPIHINYYKDLPVLTLRSEPLNELSNRIKKRIFDIILSSLIIIFILSWLVPIVALLILLDSRGPVFFVQSRSGKNNLSFNCIKFRSMKVNDRANEKQATKNDSRLTKLGKFLRKTSLDEFPQFFNVLKGNMSLVGPRPHMIKHTEEYSKIIGKYMVRQFLKPGITGWAQVNGHRGETRTTNQMIQRVEHDIWYMENWSMWLDVRIIFLTIYTTLKGDENAF